jgi:menaquinone-dependent protoporphyrinogen IX oxidase
LEQEPDMNMCVLFFGGSKREKMTEAARGLAKGLESRGIHTVQIVDGEKESGKKLTGFQYIAIGAPSENLLGGKISPNVKKFLQNCGMISGKRSFAFTINSGIRTMKTLQTLMRTMEHEGMYLKVSDIISSGSQAEAIGAKLHVE